MQLSLGVSGWCLVVGGRVLAGAGQGMMQVT